MQNSQYIKIPEGCLRICQNRKIWHHIHFFFQLKGLNIEGRLYKGSIKAQISHLKTSYASMWRYISFLKDNGLVKEYDGYYQLCSYDQLYSFLGYDVNTVIKGKKGKRRKGTFKIFKVKSNEDLKLAIYKEEIGLSLQRQTFAAMVKDKSNKRMQKQIPGTIQDYKKHLDVQNVRNIAFNLDNRNVAEYNAEMNGEDISYYNTDITLSCLNVAELFGYKSSASGYVIEQKLKKTGALSVHSRKVLVHPFMTREQFEHSPFKSSSYHYVNGKVYKQLPNMITVL